VLERAELALKIACAVLVAVLLYEALHLARRFNPLRGVSIPDVPTLAGGTNAPGTNVSITATGGTNLSTGKAGGTNVTTAQKSGTGTNHTVASQTNLPAGATNLAASGKSPDTNMVAATKADTNTVPASGTGSSSTNVAVGSISNLPGTNLSTVAKGGGTNTNATVVAKGPGADTNAAAIAAGARRGSSASARVGGPGGGRGPELSPEMKKRVDWVVRSETLAPIVRPQPMGLLGIAGDRAFIRAPNGQTDMVKEGDTLGSIKLVKIGVNRVLVEENGEPKELMIYEGYGGESLLPKSTAKTNETSATPPRSTAALSPTEAK
jgi:hypothetical protein